MACVAAAAAPVWSARRPLPLAGGIGSALARHRRAVAPCPPPNARRGQPFAEWCRENGERGERLLEEFDDDVFSPGELTKGNSERRIRWKCRECGWTWRAGLANRTKDKKPTGCPGCAGKVPSWFHSLELTCKESDGRFEHLIGEWAHPTKRMKDFTPGSNEKVPWKCGGCGHEWDAKIHTRTNATHPSGCPKCAGRHLHDLEVHCAQSDGRLDHLPREWAHPTKSIKDFAPGSNEKVPWKCGGGCPKCAGFHLHDLEVHCAQSDGRLDHLSREWAHRTKRMKDFAPASDVKVPWKCGGCGHEWDAKIHSRTRATHSNGCPKCAGRHLHDLEVHCAQSDGRLDHLPREWAHPTKSMKDFAPASDVKVPWKCGGCGHEWDATISHRTNATHPSGCPVCNPGGRNRFERQDDPVDAARVSS